MNSHRVQIAVPAPETVDKFVAVKHAVWMRRQELQQRLLAQRQRDNHAIHADLSRGLINHQPAAVKHGRGRFRTARATEDRVDPATTSAGMAGFVM